MKEYLKENPKKSIGTGLLLLLIVLLIRDTTAPILWGIVSVPIYFLHFRFFSERYNNHFILGLFSYLSGVMLLFSLYLKSISDIILFFILFLVFSFFTIKGSPKIVEKSNWHKTRSENKLYESQWYLAKTEKRTNLTKEKFVKLRRSGLIDEDGYDRI